MLQLPAAEWGCITGPVLLRCALDKVPTTLMFPWPQGVLAHNPPSLILFGEGSALRRRSQSSSAVQRGLEPFSNSQEMFVLGGETGRFLLCCLGVCWFTCDNSYPIVPCWIPAEMCGWISLCLLCRCVFQLLLVEGGSSSGHCSPFAFCLLQVSCKSLRPGSASTEKLCSSADYQSGWGQTVVHSVVSKGVGGARSCSERARCHFDLVWSLFYVSAFCQTNWFKHWHITNSWEITPSVCLTCWFWGTASNGVVSLLKWILFRSNCLAPAFCWEILTCLQWPRSLLQCSFEFLDNQSKMCAPLSEEVGKLRGL